MRWSLCVPTMRHITPKINKYILYVSILLIVWIFNDYKNVCFSLSAKMIPLFHTSASHDNGKAAVTLRWRQQLCVWIIAENVSRYVTLYMAMAAETPKRALICR